MRPPLHPPLHPPLLLPTDGQPQSRGADAIVRESYYSDASLVDFRASDSAVVALFRVTGADSWIDSH